MKEQELQEIKAKNKDLMAKACVYTNLAYALVEAADSIMLDVESMLKQLGAGVSKSEKLKYNNACRVGKQFRVWLKDLARVVYKIDVADEALDDSDKLYDIILLIMDRCGGNMNTLALIRAMIFNSFKSKYGYYDK